MLPWGMQVEGLMPTGWDRVESCSPDGVFASLRSNLIPTTCSDIMYQWLPMIFIWSARSTVVLTIYNYPGIPIKKRVFQHLHESEHICVHLSHTWANTVLHTLGVFLRRSVCQSTPLVFHATFSG